MARAEEVKDFQLMKQFTNTLYFRLFLRHRNACIVTKQSALLFHSMRKNGVFNKHVVGLGNNLFSDVFITMCKSISSMTSPHLQITHYIGVACHFGFAYSLRLHELQILDYAVRKLCRRSDWNERVHHVLQRKIGEIKVSPLKLRPSQSL